MLIVTALTLLNVSVAYAPLPDRVGATWHSRTSTLTLAIDATRAEHVEFMTEFWRLAHGLPAKLTAHRRRRHLHAVP